jgi:hypothetical protein
MMPGATSEGVKVDSSPIDRVGSSRWASWLSTALFATGAIARIVPTFGAGGRLLRELPTEDGYLMLTIARNIALGHGMSTSAGTIPTNGTQPLATFLWAACFVIAGSDKIVGVQVVLGLQLLLSVLAAYLVFRLAERVLGKTGSAPATRAKAWLAASVWFASPTVLSHSMNCLESGLYVAMIALVCWHVLAPAAQSESLRLRHWAVCGGLLGVTFWARNDAVLLCLALTFVHLAWGFPGAPRSRILRLIQMAIAGAIVVAVAAPWLIFNKARFGSLMPISGQSESLDASFGQNILIVLPNLFEYITFLVPIPHVFEGVLWMVGLVAVLTAVRGWMIWSSTRNSPSLHPAIQLGAVMTLFYSGFYGLFFGAAHFMSRYLVALSPLYAVLWGGSVYTAWRWLAERTSAALASALSILAPLLAVGLDLRAYRNGLHHPHFQVVEWIQAHVPETEWVGAGQSGTVGYFHDRTINLDGKVNPAALAARKRDGVWEYVAASPIDYLADWEAMSWLTSVPVISENFDLVVDSKETNLAVFVRKRR